MTIALVTHAGDGTRGANSSVTASCNTTGANLLIVAVATYTGAVGYPPTVSDSKGNTYTALTTYTESASGASITMFYCYAGTVGSSHTFTATCTAGLCGIIAVAFSGVASSPVDQQNGAGITNSQTGQPGSVTPSEANEVLVTAIQPNDLNCLPSSIDSGFTITDAVSNNGSFFGVGLAYLIQTTATAENPTWTTTGGSAFAKLAIAIATFKATASSGVKPYWQYAAAINSTGGL